jgi:hypothetical protein
VTVGARRLRILLLWGTLLLLGAPVALATVRTLPATTATYLLGPKMIRAEVGVETDSGLLDFRVDRGKLVKRYSGGQLVLVERDSSKVTLKVAPSAHVLLNAKLVGLRSLRTGMQVAVSRTGSNPSDIVYASSKSAPQIPPATVQYVLGNRMLRAEVFLQTPDGALHDYLLDRGRIRQTGPYSLTLREADGTIAPFSASATARVKLNGKAASFAQLRKGMTATVMRDGNKPVDQIWATGR